MPTEFDALLYAAGRLLLGGLFVFGGVEHFLAIPLLAGLMEERGVPVARATLVVGSLFQIVLGVLLMLGLLVAPATLGLVLFTILASLMFLNFWDKSGPERASDRNTFLCNIGIVGALLMTAASAM
jgi:putative oxidoreductase